MNCDDVAALLAAEFDGEIDGLRAHALRRHVAGCAACGARREAMLELTRHLRAQLPYHQAPPALRARIQAAAATAVQTPRDPAWPVRPLPVRIASRWRWFGSGLASGLAMAAVVWAAGAALESWPPGQDLASRVVGLHARATLSGRLIDIASSDRHQVKPWLSARLDYAPPVLDTTAAGFALLGARIDRLDGRAVAVLVYRHREHVIDVVVRPETAAAGAALHPVRGFNVVAASGAQMQWLAASDLNPAELSAFVQRLARGDIEAPG
jgi:anti-sigma factor RsiW